VQHKGQWIYVFPDRLVLYSGQHVGFLSFGDLRVEVGSTQATYTYLPRGCEEYTTTTTWQHQRVDGGPDRRYKDNWSTTHYHCTLGTLTLAGSNGFRIDLTANSRRSLREVYQAFLAVGGITKSAMA
jgi:hypothetical protein